MLRNKHNAFTAMQQGEGPWYKTLSLPKLLLLGVATAASVLALMNAKTQREEQAHAVPEAQANLQANPISESDLIDAREERVWTGDYGDWKPWVKVTEGFLLCGVKPRHEYPDNHWDESGTNALELHFCQKSNWNNMSETVETNGGRWGTWYSMKYCEKG